MTIFFWTDGKRFAEFVLDEKKNESAKSPQQNNNGHLKEREEK